MKSAFLLVLAFCFATTSYSQATTELEYNYMKRGYAKAVENGEDVKRGYMVEEMSPLKTTSITVYFTKLLRRDSTIAGVIVKSVSNETFGSGTTWWAIPAVSMKEKPSYGWDQFNNDVANNMTIGVKSLICQWLAYQMSWEMAKANKAK